MQSRGSGAFRFGAEGGTGEGWVGTQMVSGLRMHAQEYGFWVLGPLESARIGV
jgi:hypothetical protein